MGYRIQFYKETIGYWIKDKSASILVVASGKNDMGVFESLGFSNVVISNFDTRMKTDDFHPYTHSFQNAENLTFEDNSFDYVVVHAALHHCHSPHKALLEMYRVAKKGVIVIESRDSLLMRLIIKLNLTQVYEHAAVFYNSCKFGGVANTDIPNFVYRWTEREIEKTINSYAPYVRHKFYYRYGNDLPRSTKMRRAENYKMFFVYLLYPFYRLFAAIFPRQQNLFAVFIEQPDLEAQHFEWLKYKDGKFSFNKEWGEKYYKDNPSKKPG